MTGLHKCAGWAAILLGAVVACGWCIGSTTLVRTSSAFAPMPFNTAVGFVLVGVALVGLRPERTRTRWLPVGAGALASLLGVLALCQHALGWSLGIDQMLMDHSIGVQAPHPGRMAPNTAVCVALAGAWPVAWSLGLERRDAVLATIATVVVAFSSIALFGSLLDLEGSYGWGALTRMSVPTSLGFLVLGVGALALAWSGSYLHVSGLPMWTPMIAGTGVFITTALMSQSSVESEHRLIRDNVITGVDALADDLTESARRRAAALVRLASLGESGAPRADWFADAAPLLESDPATRWVALVDDAGEPLWPIGSFEGLDDEESALVAARVDRNVETQARTTTVRLDGRRWLVLARPRTESGRTVLAALDAAAVFGLDRAARHGRLELGYRVTDPVETTIGGTPTSSLTATTLLHVLGSTWRLEGWAPPERIEALTSAVPRVQALMGVLLAVLSVHVLRLSMRARHQSLRLEAEVAERSRAEEALERTNRNLEDFAQVVSHDLKAPLRAVISLSQWIAEDHAEVLPDEGRRQLDQLVGRAERMAAMIDGVLTYSRSSRGSLEKERVDTGLVARGVIADLDVPEGLDVRVEGPMPVVTFDPVQLQQVIQNLLDNAIRHTPAPGNVIVASRAVDDAWEVSVQDDGPGIPEEAQGRIFKVFQTLQRRDEVETTGIGLSVVKSVVERHGGRVRVDSILGAGSRFAFTVPREETHEPAADAPELLRAA